MNPEDSKPDESHFSLKDEKNPHKKYVDAEDNGIMILSDNREIIPWDRPHDDPVDGEIEEEEGNQEGGLDRESLKREILEP
jgi:hypothetical protein